MPELPGKDGQARRPLPLMIGAMVLVALIGIVLLDSLVGVISMRWRADLKIYGDGARPDPLPDARPVRGDDPESED